MPCKHGEIKCPINPIFTGSVALDELNHSNRPNREVFLFHGFDRRTARHFRLWQGRQARKYNARFATEIVVGPLKDQAWDVIGPKGRTRVHFMDWSDIARARVDAPFWVGSASMISLGCQALVQGIFPQLWRTDRAMALLTALALGPMLIALFVGLILALLAPKLLIPWVFIMVVLFWLLHRFDHLFRVYYAAHIAWIARRLACRDLPELEQRLNEFARRVGQSEADEVIIVGHSIGSALAIRAFARAPSQAKLLTLGQSIPLVSLQNEAGWAREAMERVKRDGRSWTDVSAGHDTLGFSAFDPSGGAARCYSAHFKRAFGADTVRALRWRATDMHFLYFAAPRETAGLPWDWFDWLSGTDALETRFKDETPRHGRGARNSQS